MNLTKLEDKCMNCGGKKEFIYTSQHEPTRRFKCDACNGTGLTPSSVGEEMLSFIEKYLGIERKK